MMAPRRATAAGGPEPGAGRPPLRLVWPGSGIYFWWQLGAMRHLATRLDLSTVPMTGASGGALCAALARCGADADEVLELAYQLSLEYGIWERPLGLVGVWGRIIDRWLDGLLPADAAARCAGGGAGAGGGLGVVVAALPWLEQVVVSDFGSRREVIDACLASVHVPLFLDGRPWRGCGGRACVDGSLPDFFAGRQGAWAAAAPALVLDYAGDAELARGGRLDVLRLREYSEIQRVLALGAGHARRLEDAGVLDAFDLRPHLRAPPLPR